MTRVGKHFYLEVGGEIAASNKACFGLLRFVIFLTLDGDRPEASAVMFGD